MAGKNFQELSKAKIQDTRNLVISRNNLNQGFTLAQQVVIAEGSRQTALFIKGAFHIDDIEGLYNLRDALNEAILKCEGNRK